MWATPMPMPGKSSSTTIRWTIVLRWHSRSSGAILAGMISANTTWTRRSRKRAWRPRAAVFSPQPNASPTRPREKGFTLRQAVEFGRQLRPGAFVGSAATVAQKMADWFEARAVDGFNIYIGHPGQFDRFTQEVIPLLQERGVYRTAYEGSTLRESLGLAIPRLQRHPSS